MNAIDAVRETADTNLGPLLAASAYGIVAARTGRGDLVPVSIVVFGALVFALSAGDVFDPRAADGRLERVTTAILGHRVLRAVAALGVVGMYVALFDAVLQ